MYSINEFKMLWLFLLMLVLNIILIKILNKLQKLKKIPKNSLINKNMHYSLYIIIPWFIVMLIQTILLKYLWFKYDLREYYLSYTWTFILTILFWITGIHGFINKKNIKDSTFNQWNNVTLIAFILLLFNLLLFFIWYYK